MQGMHQVAQKSRSTTLPFRLSRVTVLPSRVCKEKAGAGSLVSAKAARAETSRQAPSVKTIPVRRSSALDGIAVSFQRPFYREGGGPRGGRLAACPGTVQSWAHNHGPTVMGSAGAPAAAARPVAAAAAEAGATAPGIARLPRAATRGGKASWRLAER